MVSLLDSCRLNFIHATPPTHHWWRSTPVLEPSRRIPQGKVRTETRAPAEDLVRQPASRFSVRGAAPQVPTAIR